MAYLPRFLRKGTVKQFPDRLGDVNLEVERSLKVNR